MWTWSSRAYTTTKPLAFVASLSAQETRRACGALVDNARAWDAARERWQGGRRVSLAPGCLPTRVVAKATPTLRNKAASTERAYTGARPSAIVTQRSVRHSH